jgi:hypothetical protein
MWPAGRSLETLDIDALISRYIASGRPQQKTPFPNNSPIVTELIFSCRCIDTAVIRLLIAHSFPRKIVYRVVD